MPVGIPGDESADIICVVENSPIPKALVACPNGSVFRFEPSVFEPGFWAFAARNYYLVTGNIADRTGLAERAGVDMGSGEIAAEGSESDIGVLQREGSNWRIFNTIVVHQDRRPMPGPVSITDISKASASLRVLCSFSLIVKSCS